MNIPQALIIDVLPLYEAGDVSPDTRRIVEEYLRQHPELARPASHSVDALLKSVPPTPVERERRAALERTRHLLTRRQTFFGAALFCTLTTFMFAFQGDHVTWFMWRDAPGIAGVLMGVGIGCWIGYFKTRQQLHVAGM